MSGNELSAATPSRVKRPLEYRVLDEAVSATDLRPCVYCNGRGVYRDGIPCSACGGKGSK